MKRFHLFEIEDQPWLPQAIRQFATDYLRFVQKQLKIHELIAKPLREFLELTETRRVVDLCSGSGGMIPDLAQQLKADDFEVEFLLTDLFPHDSIDRLTDGVTIHAQPVDARAVPDDLPGCRTIFNGFHHFDSSDAVDVLKNVVNSSQPIFIVEVAERRFVNILGSFLIPFFVLATTPMVRPRTFARFVFTYLLPVVPFVCWWDGLISQLRAYNSDELLELGLAASPDYLWKVGTINPSGSPIRITFLTGRPSVENREISSAEKFNA